LLMVLSGGGIVVQSFVAGWATSTIGERRSVILGMTVNCAGFAAIGLAATVPQFWAAMSLLSKRVDVDQQGQLQGSLAILFGASQLIGPLAYTNVFAWAVRGGAWLHLPGLPMLMGSALLLVSIVLAVIYARPPDHPAEHDDDTARERPPDLPLAPQAH